MFFVEFIKKRDSNRSSVLAFNLTATHTIEVGSETNLKGFIELSHERTTAKIRYPDKKAAMEDFNNLMAAIRTGKKYYQLSGNPD